MPFKFILLSFVILISFQVKTQSLYFPPLTGTTWDSITPQNMGYCQPRIDSLYNYLQAKHTKSFIIIKDGKRVLEKYFGTYTRDSLFYWASASKSLASFITGLAQQKGYININNTVSQYIGSGWSSEPPAKESLITVKDLLEMMSGMDDAPPSPCTNEDTAKACLIYKVDENTRWAYHTGAYKKVQDVVSHAVGQNYNLVTNNWIEAHTGMSGIWIDQTYYSKARDMARFGLLCLNKGRWNTDTLMKDSAYYKAMINTSQNFNLSYGYLWWLNGKPTYMNPGIQLVLTGPLIPNCPGDMFAALGKNDQKIYIIPSQNMVVIRQGNSADGMTFALSNFDNTLWDYINKLNCSATSISEYQANTSYLMYPNPINDFLSIENPQQSIMSIKIDDVLGNIVFMENDLSEKTTINIDMSRFNKGVYFVELINQFNIKTTKKVIKN